MKGLALILGIVPLFAGFTLFGLIEILKSDEKFFMWSVTLLSNLALLLLFWHFNNQRKTEDTESASRAKKALWTQGVFFSLGGVLSIWLQLSDA